VTSFSASSQITTNILTDGEPAVKRFLHLLKSGDSDYPVEVLKKARVDMTTPQP
jgi:oligoendopeptidase F